MFLFILVSIGTHSCGDGLIREYKNANGGIWCTAPVKVDANAICEFTIVTDFGYPELHLDFGCNPWVINHLQNIEAELLVNGIVVPPDAEEMQASYISTIVDLKGGECCDSLGTRIGVDTSQIDPSFSCSVKLTKKYSSMKEFPKQLSVHLTSKTTGGDTDTTIVLVLDEFKDTRAPIRIH